MTLAKKFGILTEAEKRARKRQLIALAKYKIAIPGVNVPRYFDDYGDKKD
jgi:hypothetical protein